MLKPVVDMPECILCGLCESVCPEIFIENQLGYMEVAETEEDFDDQIQEAVNCCPRGCIHLE